MKWLGPLVALLILMPAAGPAAMAAVPVETPFLAPRVATGALPPVASRLPDEPLVVDPPHRGRELGRPGGDIVTMVARARDIRYLSAYSYARLVGYDEGLRLQADLLKSFDEQDQRIFTFHLRAGHKWSDGEPFTAEDFRYWWEDVANAKQLSPAGIPEFMMVEGKPPRFEVIDPLTVRFSWEKPNPRFLPTLAAPRDPFIYRPAHYLKQFHAKYNDPARLDTLARGQKLKSWAALHNRMDDMFENANPDLPTLQAWRVTNAAPATRFVFERNPFYHRVDTAGQQLPYVDRVLCDVATGGLMAAKSNAGEADLQARGLTMADIPVLKEGEKARGYRTLLWSIARGSEIALYPNLTVSDPVWRKLNRDVRFRRALSMAIDRKTLNNALLFGLGKVGNNTVDESSPLFEPAFRTLNARYEPEEASRLLDEIGLTARDGNGIRLLPDGRLLEIVVEVDGESAMMVDGLELIGEFWREVGVKLFVKPQERTILRNRVYSGLTVMTANVGLDNALPTPVMPPFELAPARQDNYAWPAWGQHMETHGTRGEAVDMSAPARLMALYRGWLASADELEHARIWKEMLRIHAEQQFVIGTVAGALQPIVINTRLKNLRDKGIYSWEPTSLLGVYRIDEIFWGDDKRREASVR